MSSPLLVTADWLADNINKTDLTVIDASFHLPNSGRDVTDEYLAKHIPGAVLFDINRVKDTESALPHMLPNAEEFGAMVGALGISNDDHIIAYDSIGIFSAPRAWWMFRAMGHENVSVLDGGLPAWENAGHPTEDGNSKHIAASYKATLNPEMVVNFKAMQEQVADGMPVVDARAAERFAGGVPEPREGLRSGHIPGSMNLPFNKLLDPETGGFADHTAIKAAFEQAGIDLNQPLITSCGSGVTAAVLTFALAMLGKHDVQLYDGSWAEWGMEGGPDIATGPAA